LDKLRRDRIIFIGLGIILTISTYAFLRYSYKLSDGFPFSQEIIAAIMGAIITILITAALLNKQTEVELLKEENLKFLELKSGIYIQLLDYIEDIILSETISYKDLIRLRILNQKISFVASTPVLEAFGKFIDFFGKIVEDRKLVDTEVDQLLRLMGDLSIQIRYDLMQGHREESESERRRDANQIRRNVRKLELKWLRRKENRTEGGSQGR
jgi:hypothetical protein